MLDIFLRGEKGAERTPLKINLPLDSKTTGQIFMKFKMKILGMRLVVIQ